MAADHIACIRVIHGQRVAADAGIYFVVPVDGDIECLNCVTSYVEAIRVVFAEKD